MVINAYLLAAEPAYIEASVSSYYDVVERIIVSYDRAGRGWTGAALPVAECLDRLRAIDPAKKMRFCPGDFARPGHPPIENDTEQRRHALEAARSGADWVLAIDTDEVVPDAAALVRRLEDVSPGFPAVEWPMRSFFRRLNAGVFLEVCTPSWRQLSEYPGCVATRGKVTLVQARRVREAVWRFDIRSTGIDPLEGGPYTAHGVVAGSEAIFHFSWARSESELLDKVRSWGHSKDFDWQRYVDRVWKPAPWRWPWTRNFHPVTPRRWPALRPWKVPGRLLTAETRSSSREARSALDLLHMPDTPTVPKRKCANAGQS
jgi:hypothetical protein